MISNLQKTVRKLSGAGHGVAPRQTTVDLPVACSADKPKKLSETAELCELGEGLNGS